MCPSRGVENTGCTHARKNSKSSAGSGAGTYLFGRLRIHCKSATYSGSLRELQNVPPVCPAPPAAGFNGLRKRRLLSGSAVLMSFVTTSKLRRDCSAVHPASVAGVSRLNRTLVCHVWHITHAA